VSRSYPPTAEARTVVLRVPITPQERAELSARAEAAGRSMAEVARVAILSRSWQAPLREISGRA
jgi:mobilization protein NikA